MAVSPIALTPEYLALQKLFPLRPIRNAVQHKIAIQVLIELASSNTRMTKEKHDYIEVLSSLAESYEKTILPPSSEVPPQEILRFLMAEHKLKQVDLLPLVGYKSHLSAFLKGKRNLSKQVAAKLGAKFKIDPMLFLPRIKPVA